MGSGPERAHGLVLLAAFVAAACDGGTKPPPTEPPDSVLPPDTSLATDLPLEAAAERITAANLEGRIQDLADDSMRGRATPSPELEKAASYIARAFEEAGLEPAGSEGMLHRWQLTEEYLDTTGVAMRLDSPEVVELAWPGDFMLVRDRDRTVVSGELYFAGSAADTGAVADSVLKGKLALFYNPEPAVGSAWQLNEYAGVTKAQKAGAEGVGFVLAETFGPAEVAELARDRVESRYVIPWFGLSDTATIRLADALGWFASNLRNDTPKPLGGRLTVEMPVAGDVYYPPNVAAVLPGSDPALQGQHVVLTAHFDHVGVGPPGENGDSIYNGADDNASGTAMLLELADALGSMPVRPRRSILFLALSGEELGLDGAEAYLAAPTVPVDSMVADLNFDMVGRGPAGELFLVGQRYSTLGSLTVEVAQHFPELGLKLRDGVPGQNLYGRSDQLEFARERVPALLFFAGFHADYHTPRDHADLIDTAKSERIARLALWVIGVAASQDMAPEWTPEGVAALGGFWVN